jgi:superfamily II DNA/RNA helicase
MANSKQTVSHVYYEVGSELLAKPTALTQLIEGSDARTTIVFCNSASDTDLVEVLLKKRGVSAQKLIGSVSPEKIARTIEQLNSGEITTIVATDASAKNIPIDSFNLLISYTSPTDGDTYKNRYASEDGLKNLLTIATLVSPNDAGNFEIVQQALDGKITKADLPTADTLQKAKLNRIKAQAQTKTGAEEKYKALIEAILADKEKGLVIGYLLANTLEVLPSLQAAQSREEEHYDDEDAQPNFNSSHHDRNGGNRYGNGRNDRNDRRGNNDRGRNNGRNTRDNRGGRQQFNDAGDDSEASLQAREAMARNKKRAFTPPLKEARIYLGKGSASGISEATIKKMVQEQGALTEGDVRRVIVRKNYAFFDVLESQSEDLINKIDGTSLMAKKATVISTQIRDRGEDDNEFAPTLEEATAQASGGIAANAE